jgi:hypothetical protein
LRQKASAALLEAAGLSPLLMAVPSGRETEQNYVQRKQQAMAPLEPQAQSIKVRWQDFIAHMADCALRYHGENSPGRSVVVIFGKKYAETLADDAVRGKDRKSLYAILDAGPIKYLLKEEAVRPEPREDKAAWLKQVILNGHWKELTQSDQSWAQTYFLQTGWTAIPGQAERCWSAQVIARNWRDGKRVHLSPQSSPDLVEWVMLYAQLGIDMAVLDDLDPNQVSGLEALLDYARQLRFMNKQEQSAIQMLENPETTPAEPAAIPGVGSSPPPGGAQGAGTPAPVGPAAFAAPAVATA